MMASVVVACLSGAPLLALGLVMDAQQILVAPRAGDGPEAKGCHTAVAGDECYEEVTWAMNTGIVQHPEWYPTLTTASSFADFQTVLSSKERRSSSVCSKPCETQCSTSAPGDACYEKVLYAMGKGIKEHPEWYPTLTSSSTFREVQQFLHGMSRLSDVCPNPCEGAAPAKLVASETCRTALQGDDCFAAVEYAMKEGFPAHPDWYPTLTARSTFEEFQEYLHSLDRLSHVCAKPCRAPGSNERLAAASSEYPVIPHYVQVAVNCECSPPDRRDSNFADSNRSEAKCAEWCDSEERCKSFGFWGDGPLVQPHLKKHCRLYFDFCDSTDGWANDTTCAYPTFKNIHFEDNTVVYNRVPTAAPTATPTLAPTTAGPTAAPTPTSAPTPAPPSPAPTPFPTLEPGMVCPCEKCSWFYNRDLDGDGCISKEEGKLVTEVPMGTDEDFDVVDTDKDGCFNKTECELLPFEPSTTPYIPNPNECDVGFYLMPDMTCAQCEGGAVRRRAGPNILGECTPCSKEWFDAGEFDDCITSIYMTRDAAIGDTRIYVDKVEGLYIHDRISISERVPGHYQEAWITGLSDSNRRLGYSMQPQPNASEGFIELDQPLRVAFKMYDAITPICSHTEGSTVPEKFPCGCGKTICWEPGLCFVDEPPDTINGTTGVCPPVNVVPTPYPTVSAKGDPHLVNLQGEHFDINHGGEFDLLRMPKDTRKPAEFVLKASIRPEFGKPCTTFITEVELTGSWFDHKVVKVRSYLQSHAANETDKFLGIQQLQPGEQQQRAWTAIADWSSEDMELSGPRDTVEAIVSKTQWSSRKRVKAGMPTLAGQFVFYLRHRNNSEPAKITIRQDLPGQEHLNVAVRRLSALGRDALEVGGLLGFTDHAASLEEVTPECQRHRDGLDGRKGPKNEPAWKTRWNKIKEHRKRPSDDEMRDNEAAASLMCVCDTQQAGVDGDLTEEDAEAHGVITEFQTARLAEVSWD